jgi:hypothetical protein
MRTAGSQADTLNVGPVVVVSVETPRDVRCRMWDAGDTAGDERTTLSRVADGNFDYFVLC